MLVVDTNILVPLFVTTQNTSKCQALHGLDADWHLADWWQVEFANVLRNLHRAKQITAGDATRAMDEVLAFIPDGNTHAVAVTPSLVIACQSNISAYDARFITIARTLGQKLITEDSRLRRACPDDTLALDEALAPVA